MVLVPTRLGYWFLILSFLAWGLTACSDNSEGQGDRLPPASAYAQGADELHQMAYLSKEIKLEPRADLLFLRARLYARWHYYPQALADIRAARSMENNRLEYEFLEAQVRLAMGQADDLRVQIKTLENTDFSHPDLPLFFLAYYLQRGERAPSLLWAQRSQARHGQSLDWQLAQRWLRGDSLGVLRQLARERSALRIPLWDRLRLQKASAYRSQAEEAELLRYLIQHWPFDGNYQLAWAQFLVDAGQAAAAEKIYLRAFPLLSDPGHGHYLLGQFYFTYGNYSKAMAQWANMPKAHPEYPIALLQKALAYRYLRKITLSDRLMDSLKTAYPQLPYIQSAWLRMRQPQPDSLSSPIDSLKN